MKIINLTFGIFRYVESVYITGYRAVLYRKINSTVGYFLATFCWLINCMN